jgi:hypothetical protein
MKWDTAKTIEVAITGGVAALIALGAALGFTSPREAFTTHADGDEKIHKDQEVRLRAMEVYLPRIDQKLEDLVRGLSIPRRHAGAYRAINDQGQPH